MKTYQVLSKRGIGKVIINVFPLFFLIVSCTVTNNLYINDPVPLEKHHYCFYGGIGMGLAPEIDEVADNGEVFCKNLKYDFNLSLGGKYGFTDHFNAGATIHFPKIIGGAGISLRPQFSLFHHNTIFNIAINADLGIVFPQDSIKFLGTSFPLETETKGAMNADLAIPFSFRLYNNTRLIVTPRYSYNSFALREEYDSEREKKKKVRYPALSLGIKINKIFLESSVIHWDNKQFYVFGLVYVFSDGSKLIIPEKTQK